MNQLRTLTVGASGYVGSALYAKAMVISDAIATSRSSTPGFAELRLEDADRFNFQLIKPGTCVFLLAAISAPDVCAREHARAWSINVTGTSKFIENIIARDGRVVFFSSDTVYGERNEKFDERADCNPAGEYAVMKHEVEQRFAADPSFKTIRLSYVFSRNDKFTRYLAGCAERNEEAELFHPFYRAIVHRDDVVEGALALAQKWDDFPQSVINFGGPAILSRVEFAECLRQMALPSLRYRVTEPDEAFFNNRPRTIAMCSPDLPKLLQRPSRNLIEAAKIEFASNSI